MLLKKFTPLFVLLFVSMNVIAQKAKVTGKVLNTRNEALAGVSVRVEGLPGGTTTAVDGGFVITVDGGKTYTIVLSYVGYEDKKLATVTPKSGEVINLEMIVLDDKKNADLDNVVVKGRSRSLKSESINSMIQYQRNTNTVAQVISAEAIRRSPDKNTGEVLKRIPGTSIQDGKYLIVRGLSDRYNQAMLNGIQLSSTEPDRKTFSFDIFPSSAIENIVINKAFVPELPGEWAGGLVQVQTKDIPAANFLNIQIGTGFNTQTIGSDFMTYNGGKLDWLGFDDKSRRQPEGLPQHKAFSRLTHAEKTEFGKQFANNWGLQEAAAATPLNESFQLNGGFNKSFKSGKKLGMIVGITYNRSVRRVDYENRFFTINGEQSDINFNYFNKKYSQDVLWGAMGNTTLQLNANNKISWKNLININASDYTTLRTGKDFENDPVLGENIRAQELGFRSNIFFNTQLTGEHNLPTAKLKLKWYGNFNILDQYIPEQRRVQYNQNLSAGDDSPYLLLMSNTRSQKTGSIFYSNLNDYIYTAGGELSRSFKALGRNQSVKAGYVLQVKDRLFDSRPFSIYLPSDNKTLRMLPADQVFDAANFGDGTGNLFGFDEISGNQYRYMANTILNAGFVQFDNQLTQNLRAVWGVRFESFDQVVGSPKASDPRHVNSLVNDWLPGLNLTYKLGNTSNLRLSCSQTVVRPEFRELSPFAFFDFELGATVMGNASLERTKISNADLRYEMYPRAGELVTIGAFYKYFDKPIELYFNQSGVGTSNTFNYLNADKAVGYGVEFDLRKKLDFISQSLKNLTFQTNLSYIYNEVKDSKTNLKRPMQGQSPYLVNAALQYDVEKLGLNTTLLFNQIGRRILYVGNDQIPAIWEAPRPLLDFQVAKKIMNKKGEIKLNISDIFNKRAFYYHDLDVNGKYTKTGSDALAINRRFGTNVSLSFGYNFSVK